MSRNRTVSSSAIARAVSDAAAGEYASAIETLVTAISLIKQSKARHLLTIHNKYSSFTCHATILLRYWLNKYQYLREGGGQKRHYEICTSNKPSEDV